MMLKNMAVDQELSAKIQSELDMERETRDSDKVPASISEYLESSSFEVASPFPFFPPPAGQLIHPPKLHDTPGQEEVVLTRKFGDESIRVSFSIADLNAVEPEEDGYGNEDPAMYDEEGAGANTMQSGGANVKGTINQGRTQDGNINVAPQDRIAPADRQALADDESPSESPQDPGNEPSFPARVSVMIEKAGKGTLQLETTAENGEIVIDNVYYFADAELADAKTAELDWKRRNLYEGPPFGNLDETLQVLLERYIDERGINTALAIWVPEYIDFKEQREYLRWMTSELIQAFLPSRPKCF